MIFTRGMTTKLEFREALKTNPNKAVGMAQRACAYSTRTNAARVLGVSRRHLDRIHPPSRTAEKLRASGMRARLDHASGQVRHEAHDEILRTCAGCTLAQAASKWGVSYPTFRAWLRRIPGGLQDAKARSAPARKTLRARIYGPSEADAQAALAELVHVLSAAQTGAEAADLLGTSVATVTRLRSELQEVLPSTTGELADEHRAAMQALPPEILATARPSLLGNWVVTVDGVAEPLRSLQAIQRAVAHCTASGDV